MKDFSNEVTGRETDLELAARLARQAGELLVQLRERARQNGISPEKLKSMGDSSAQTFLGHALRELRPADAVLSEEAHDDASRTMSQRVWIIDPLDGTREFSEGRQDWAVHVALWVSGTLSVGAVALPGLGIVLDSGTAPQTWAPLVGPLRMAVSRSRASGLVTALAGKLGATLVPMGSAGYKVGAVIRGEVDAYVHSGGQYEWDSAAPVVVAESRGLHVSRIDGSNLEYNQVDPYLPDVLVCRKDVATMLLREIEQIYWTKGSPLSGLKMDGMYTQ